MGYHLTTASEIETRSFWPSAPTAKYTLCHRKPARGPIFKWVLSTKYTDSETGLLYFGYRFYMPDTGRWVSHDPLEEMGGVNIDAYLKNDPVSGGDLLGLMIVSFWTFDSVSGERKQMSSLDISAVGHPSNSLDDTKGYAHLERGTDVGRIWRGSSMFNSCVTINIYVSLPKKLKPLTEMSFPTLPQPYQQPWGGIAMLNFHVAYRPHEDNGIGDSSIFGPFLEVVLAHEDGHVKGWLDHIDELKTSLEGLGFFASNTDVDNAVNNFEKTHRKDSNQGANKGTRDAMRSAGFSAVNHDAWMTQPDGAGSKDFTYTEFWKK